MSEVSAENIGRKLGEEIQRNIRESADEAIPIARKAVQAARMANLEALYVEEARRQK